MEIENEPEPESAAAADESQPKTCNESFLEFENFSKFYDVKELLK